MPNKKGPYPAIVLVHGSGATEKSTGDDMANHYVKMGFAVLTHDKRGVGKSGGVYEQRNNVSEENLTLLAKDIYAGINFLKKRPDIDNKQIGLYGASQAGWIIPIVASMEIDIKFSILISGPTVTVGEEIYYSQLANDSTKLSKEEISLRVRQKGPFGFDPVPYLKQSQMKGLWLLGEEDQSIPIPETIAILDKLIIEDRRDFHYEVFKNANHFLRVQGQRAKGYWQVPDNFLLNQVKIEFR